MALLAYRVNMASSLPAQRTWWTRTTTVVRTFVREALSRVRSLRTPPGRPGMSSGRVATPARAEQDLSALASSPTVFTAINRLAFSIVMYPVRVYFGYSIGGQSMEALDPERVPWVGSFLRLLQTPDPADAEALFPATPGESMLAQLLADLKLAGNAFVAVVTNGQGDIIGLIRAHPRCVTLERRHGEEYWVHRVSGEAPRYYPRRTVAHIRLLSWQSDGRAELGVGAGTALAPLVAAEAEALQQTANVIHQGGADVMIVGKTPQAANYLTVQANRDAVAEQASKALSGGPTARRVFVIGGDFELKDAGLSPADLRAPETLKEARASELMAIGVVPVAVGSDAGTYATAVQQYRVQAEQDEALCGIIEAFLFRPLARHFARRAGGRWAVRADQVTARWDLASHPGNMYVRSEAIDRMKKLMEMGYSAPQAAEAESVDLPEPDGEPRFGGPAAFGGFPGAPAPSGGGNGKPAAPVGDKGGEPGDPGDGADAPSRTIGTWFGRAAEGDAAPATAAIDLTRWRAIEAKREASDRALEVAAGAVLAAERTVYVERAVRELRKAERGARPRVRASGEDPGGEDPEPPKTDYGDVDMQAILGDDAEALQRWMDGLSPDWTDTWERSADEALADTSVAGDVPVPTMAPSHLAPLEDSSSKASGFSRERVEAVIRAGMDRGDSVNDIQKALMEDQAWTPERALRVARTETVRAESSGANARYEEASAAGVALEEEWLSDDQAAQWPRRHDLMHGKVVAVGADFVLPSGVRSRGPGLSGDAGEDVNCRCGKAAKVAGT